MLMIILHKINSSSKVSASTINGICTVNNLHILQKQIRREDATDPDQIRLGGGLRSPTSLLLLSCYSCWISVVRRSAAHQWQGERQSERLRHQRRGPACVRRDKWRTHVHRRQPYSRHGRLRSAECLSNRQHPRIHVCVAAAANAAQRIRVDWYVKFHGLGLWGGGSTAFPDRIIFFTGNMIVVSSLSPVLEFWDRIIRTPNHDPGYASAGKFTFIARSYSSVFIWDNKTTRC